MAIARIEKTLVSNGGRRLKGAHWFEIQNRRDFLKAEGRWDWAVGNPPFSLFGRFSRRPCGRRQRGLHRAGPCWSGSTVRRPPWPVFAQSRRAISTNSGGYNRRQTGECNLLTSSSIILTEGSCSTNAARRSLGMLLTASSTMRLRKDSTSNVFFPAFRRLGLFRSWRIPFRAWLYRDRHRLRHWRSRPRVSPAFPLKLLYPSVQ